MSCLQTIAAMTNPEHKIRNKDDLLKALQQQGLTVSEDDMIEKDGTYKVTVNGITQIISNSGNVRDESGVEKSIGKTKAPAPIVVAKGVDYLAFQIREIAKDNNVPIVENRPLARTLYNRAPVDGMIPSDMYVAVAEILAYVFKQKNGER